MIFVEEKDFSTGERTICYSAFENLRKAPDNDKLKDTIVNGQEGVVYNGQIALKVSSYSYSSASHVKSGVFSIIYNFPDGMTSSGSLLDQQADSWSYAYSSKEYLELIKTEAEEKKPKEEEEVFTIVEEMPEFPGGEGKLSEYLVKNMQYPQEARENGIQGRVFVIFVVEPDGSVSNVNVMRSLGGGCDEEAVRLVKNMPKWEPGKQRGKNVRVSYILPITFK